MSKMYLCLCVSVCKTTINIKEAMNLRGGRGRMEDREKCNYMPITKIRPDY